MLRLAIIASALVLILTSRCIGTPMVAVHTPNFTVVGTNGLTDHGDQRCKLLANKTSVVIVQDRLFSVGTAHSGDLVHPNIGLRKAMASAKDIDSLQALIVASLQQSARDVAQWSIKLGLARRYTPAQLLDQLKARVLLIKVMPSGQVEIAVLLTEFTDWPNVVAHTHHYDLPMTPVYAFVASKELQPISQGPMTDRVGDVFYLGMELNDIQGQMRNDPGFRGPFDIVSVDKSGVHWEGSQTPGCAREAPFPIR
jgi:hypothetical protein